MSQNKIISYLINNCPVGELGQLIHDLQMLCTFNQSDFIEDIKQNYEQHFSILQQNDEKFIIGKSLKELNGYQDGKGNVYQVDFLEQQIEKINSENYQQNPLQDKLFQLINTYRQEYFSKDNSACVVRILNDEILVVIASKLFNFKNFCGGEWNSEWRIVDQKMIGKIQINTHYFEDGNVQLKMEKQFEYQIVQEKLIEKQIQKFIQNSDEEVTKILEEFYETMSKNVLKLIRRNLPITNSKMDWNLQTHKLLANLKQV